ncbi:MAG: malate synthase A [Thermoplasmatota archaeon]
MTLPPGVELTRPLRPGDDAVLSSPALAFVASLERTFGARRRALLAARAERQMRIDRGEMPDFLPETRDIRASDWRIAPVPADLLDRRVEITGPVDRKMIVNALNSGASVFMADFEDANSPTWENCVDGQLNLTLAIDRKIDFTTPEGKSYALAETTATLLVRPRGWHLDEKHVRIDGTPMSASLFDFGLYFFANADRLVARGTGPYFYLPKMESHLEARLWNDVFTFSERALGLPPRTIKATVLIETILAAFEMDEILFELRDHSAGLNAGRWDYLFSLIKKFRNHGSHVLPDRSELTMTTPFMRAYAQLLVATCHRRGAHAIGGMAAFIPNRKDAHVTEVALAKVRDDKEREAGDGFDGTWVAHPDLVPVARAVFDKTLGDRPNQLARSRDDVRVAAQDLLDARVAGGVITEAGLRTNVNVGVLYLESWLRGTGAAALYNLMEDAATAEISRSQVWQWLRHRAKLADGRPLTRELVRATLDDEMKKIEALVGPAAFASGKFAEARSLFEEVALAPTFPEFLTIPAYAHLP